jgi:hypothetical protein
MILARTVECPRCRWGVVQRSPRTGLFERLISLLYVYPFRCQVCMYRFRAWRLGTRYSRQRDDRREYARVEVRLPVVASFHRSHSTGELIETSVTGGTLETDLQLPEGALIQLEIELPDGKSVAVDGAVVRSVRAGSLGLSFTWMRVPERARLEAFVIGALGLADDVPAAETETERPETSGD